MIEVRNIWKRFKKQQVFAGLDLQIQEGETLVILGSSGVGKSVLLKHIIGLSKPDHGTIHVDGVDITQLSSNELLNATARMGMLFQGGALFDSMNVAENAAFYLNEHTELKNQHSPEEIRHRVEEALEMVGLPNILEKMPSELSGGMRKRVALARLVVYRPQILLYDEPTSGLDPITSKQISDLIVKMQTELNATSIVVTHDVHSALTVGDRLALLRNGRILHIDTPENFMKINDPLIDYLKH